MIHGSINVFTARCRTLKAPLYPGGRTIRNGVSSSVVGINKKLGYSGLNLFYLKDVTITTVVFLVIPFILIIKMKYLRL
jgi:hypothetical protein